MGQAPTCEFTNTNMSKKHEIDTDETRASLRCSASLPRSLLFSTTSKSRATATRKTPAESQARLISSMRTLEHQSAIE